MKKIFIILFLYAAWVHAENNVSVPWKEFKQLYTESIERALAKTHSKEKKTVEPFIFSLEKSSYHFRIDEKEAHGEVEITGKVLSGKPALIPLFEKDVILGNNLHVTGGTLLVSQEDHHGISFLPDTNSLFHIKSSLMTSLREDKESEYISFSIPTALRNTLELEKGSKMRLLEVPGLPDAEGIYHFPASDSLCVRWKRRLRDDEKTRIEMNAISTVKTQGRRIVIETIFMAQNNFPETFTLRLDSLAQYESSSLKSSWLTSRANNVYDVHIPPEADPGFTVKFSIKEKKEGGYNFSLPAIKDNQGVEGVFILDEPNNVEAFFSGTGLEKNIYLEDFFGPFQEDGDESIPQGMMRIPNGKPVALKMVRFEPADIPPIILDSQHYYTSFEENGNNLSVLVMDVPPEVGTRLFLKAIPESEIWSLKVNGKKSPVYTNKDSWIIPLDAGKTSKVQLALHRKTEKLGIHGRLEIMVPETGLPSQTFKVGIALPERLELLSLEGPVSSASRSTGKSPSEFVGKPYFFSRTFYKGEEMKLAIYYKEPVKE